MHGYLGWKYPRFEDFEYTSWLPEDDSMAWIGNGNTVAEFTNSGDTTNYMDYTDCSKVLPVPIKDSPGILPGVIIGSSDNGELGNKTTPMVPSANPGKRTLSNTDTNFLT